MEAIELLPVSNPDVITFGDIAPNKQGVETISQQLIMGVKEGLIDPINLIIQMTAIGDVCAAVRAGIVDDVVDLLDKEKGKVEKFGAKLEKAETGVKYDYSNNTAWVNLKGELDGIKEKQSALEKRLKTIPAGSLLVDEATGETLIGPSKSSTTSFKITLGK